MLKNEYLEVSMNENTGSKILNRGYDLSIKNNYSELVIKDLHFATVDDYIILRQECKKANINTFVFIDQSTALMEELHGLNAAGMILNGICEVHQWDKWEEKDVIVKGLRINIL